MRNIHYFLIALLVSMMLSSAVFADTFELDLYRPTTSTLLYDPQGKAPNLLGYTPPNPKPVISGTVYSGVSPAPHISYTTTTPINTSAGVKQIAVNRAAAINMGSLGATVAKFARVAGPVNMGITAATLICTLSDICQNATTQLWEKKADPGLSGYPATTPDTYGWYSNGWNSSVTQAAMSIRAPTPAVSCENLVRVMNSDPYWAGSRTYGPITGSVTSSTATTMFCGVIFHNNVTPSPVTNYPAQASLGACPMGYSANPQGGCTLNGNSVPHPVQDSDWTAAAAKLGDAAFVQSLLDAAEPVPVTVPPRVADTDTVISTTSVPTLDGQGNTTGRIETTKTVRASDQSSGASPNSFTVTENSTSITYNISNQVINTTNTSTPLIPPAPVAPVAEPTTFDGVTDATIQTVQVNPPSDSSSWGEGSCPAPQTVVTHFGSLTIPTAPACDFATMIKPIVLLCASLAAMFIVSGIKEA